MSITSVTVTGTATFAGGTAVPNAVVSFIPDQLFTQAGTTVSVGVSTFANANGAWTLAVNATDDSGTAPANGGYFVRVIDPLSGEHVTDMRCHVTQANASTTVSVLQGAAF